MRKTIYIFLKDINSEIRNRYSINALLMFVIVAISVILFSIGSEKVPENIFAGLYWVIVFFTAMTGLSRAFVSEEERGTNLFLTLVARPSSIFLGKYLFNIVLTFVLNLLITILSLMLFNDFIIRNYQIFIVSFIFGNIGIATTSTFIASIISKANAKGTLYPVLSFPVLLPLIMVLMQLTKAAIEGQNIFDVEAELVVLFCYDIIIFTASILLFDLIWKD